MTRISSPSRWNNRSYANMIKLFAGYANLYKIFLRNIWKMELFRKYGKWPTLYLPIKRKYTTCKELKTCFTTTNLRRDILICWEISLQIIHGILPLERWRNNLFALGELYCGEPWWVEGSMGDRLRGYHLRFSTLHSFQVKFACS